MSTEHELGKDSNTYISTEDQSVRTSGTDTKQVPVPRKKLESDYDSLLSRIKKKEQELDNIKIIQLSSVNKELRALKSEKYATIEKRKQIDVELDKSNRDLPEKMRLLSQLESSLIYKNEDKINTAIQRLDWTLQHQHFKLTEERKIVTEIDRLRRSKKTLVQYFTLKQEINVVRDKLRRMREERDTYYKSVSKMKIREEHLKQMSVSLRTQLDTLKEEIDLLYEQKRQIRKPKEDFQGPKERLKKDSWRKRDEHRKSFTCDKHQEEEEMYVTYEKLIQLCTTLYNHLHRYTHQSPPELSVDSLSLSSSLEADEEGEEGYGHRKKSGDSDGAEFAAKKAGKKNKKSRKLSSFKKMTHTSQVLEQFLALGVNAPSTVNEIPEVLEKLRQKKLALETEQQPTEVASDAGLSTTESNICEISRQGSKTESYEGCVDTHPGDCVYDELMETSEGAVGGCMEPVSDISDLTSPNSDSTLEGDSGESRSSSVVKSEDGAGRLTLDLSMTEADKSNNNIVAKSPHHRCTINNNARRNIPPKNLDWRPKLRKSKNMSDECCNPATLLISPSLPHASVALVLPLDAKDFKPKLPVSRVASSPAAFYEQVHRNLNGTFADQLKSPGVNPLSFPLNAHQRSHEPLSSRLSTPASSQWTARRSLTAPAPIDINFDMTDFPPLSQDPLTKPRSSSFFSKPPSRSPSLEVAPSLIESANHNSISIQTCFTPPTEAACSTHAISVSEIPAADESSTEKWVESSVAYCHPDAPHSQKT